MANLYLRILYLVAMLPPHYWHFGFVKKLSLACYSTETHQLIFVDCTMILKRLKNHPERVKLNLKPKMVVDSIFALSLALYLHECVFALVATTTFPLIGLRDSAPSLASPCICYTVWQEWI